MDNDQQYHLWQFYKQLRDHQKYGGAATIEELVDLTEILLEDEQEPDWDKTLTPPRKELRNDQRR